MWYIIFNNIIFISIILSNMTTTDKFKKENTLITNIINDQKEYMEELIKLWFFSKTLDTNIEKCYNLINTELLKVISKEIVDQKEITNLINKLILFKLAFNKEISATNYLKWKLDVVKANTKLSLIKNWFDDWEIVKWNNGEQLVIKSEHLSSYYNVMSDKIVEIKSIKDLIDTTIISLQSQLKNLSFEYINANKISE